MLPGTCLAILIWLAGLRPAQPEEVGELERVVRQLPVGELEQRPWSEQMQFKMRVRSVALLGNDMALVEVSSLRAGSMTFQVRIFQLLMKRNAATDWVVVGVY